MNRYTQTAADIEVINRPRALRKELALDLGLVGALAAAITCLLLQWGA